MSAETPFDSITGVFPCQVHWGDCDPAGIIFYPTYFRWFDAATWAFFAAVGYGARRMRAEGLAMPLVSANCEFQRPAEQGDRCEVRSRIVRFGGKSFVVEHEVVREDGVVLARGVLLTATGLLLVAASLLTGAGEVTGTVVLAA